MTVITAITAMLVFAAATQGWFVRRNRWYESAVMLLITFTLLRPDFWVDLGWEKYRVDPGVKLMELATTALPDSSLRVRIEGTSLEGKDIKKTVLLPLGNDGDGMQRITKAGLSIISGPTGVEVMAVSLKGPAQKAGFEQGYKVTGIEVLANRPAKELLYIPAFLVLAGVFLLQRRRRELVNAAPAAALV